jgi:hypothetical protein
MITYPDGMEICVGDNVVMNYGREPGVIRAIIDSPGKMNEWNIDENGLMIECEAAGLCFWPAHSLDENEIKFKSRLAS